MTRLMEAGVALVLSQRILAQGQGVVRLACTYTGRESELDCGTLILVTGRLPVTGLRAELATLGKTAHLIGDALVPASLADAIYSAHRFARMLGEQSDPPPRREIPPHREARCPTA